MFANSGIHSQWMNFGLTIARLLTLRFVFVGSLAGRSVFDKALFCNLYSIGQNITDKRSRPKGYDRETFLIKEKLFLSDLRPK